MCSQSTYSNFFLDMYSNCEEYEHGSFLFVTALESPFRTSVFDCSRHKIRLKGEVSKVSHVATFIDYRTETVSRIKVNRIM